MWENIQSGENNKIQLRKKLVHLWKNPSLFYVILIAWGKIWTGPLDPWTILWTFFWTTFWTIFWTFFSTILSKGPPPLVLREGWDAVYQYLGRGERQTVVTQGGVEDEWKEEGWEVVIGVNATDWWSFYWIIHIFLSGFSTDWLTDCQNFLAGLLCWAVRLSCKSAT